MGDIKQDRTTSSAHVQTCKHDTQTVQYRHTDKTIGRAKPVHSTGEVRCRMSWVVQRLYNVNSARKKCA